MVWKDLKYVLTGLWDFWIDMVENTLYVEVILFFLLILPLSVIQFIMEKVLQYYLYIMLHLSTQVNKMYITPNVHI